MTEQEIQVASFVSRGLIGAMDNSNDHIFIKQVILQFSPCDQKEIIKISKNREK